MPLTFAPHRRNRIKLATDSGRRMPRAGLCLAGIALAMTCLWHACPGPTLEPLPPSDTALGDPSRDLFELTDEDPPLRTLEARVRPGQTLAGILGGYLDPNDIADLDDQVDDFSFARIRSGNPYRLTLRDRELVAFEYTVSPTRRLVIEAEQGDLDARLETRAAAVRPLVLSGTVTSSLFEAVREAGGNAELAVGLADIFACDIDFCKEVQKGDTFRAVVEERRVDGQRVGFGQILAASFVNGGDTHLGLAARDARGKWAYYDPTGRPLRKLFLRAPLSFLRITSAYTASRLHPILHVRRPHYGVDYAAPIGTPVWSVGDGVVAERGRNKAAGNYVTVRHNDTYLTRYNHLSRFAKGIRKGTKVDQGQVIGYVGRTGYATGPHLDFRMYAHGRPINSLKNTSITAAAMPASRLAAFKRRTAPLLATLRGAPAATDLADRDAKTDNRRYQ
jgi:murein DD-endopeptidase MepM/ murein hydrolase activator NlpD